VKLQDFFDMVSENNLPKTHIYINLKTCV